MDKDTLHVLEQLNTLHKTVIYIICECNFAASLYGEAGRYQESEEMFKKAMKINPTYAEAYFNLGIYNTCYNNIVIPFNITTMMSLCHYNSIKS